MTRRIIRHAIALAALLTLGAIAPVARAAAAPGAQAGAQAQVEREDLTVYVSEIQRLTPGFAMGNIVLADPKIAGYEPTPGRRELMIRGKKPGTTTLAIWDQKGVLRRELTLLVTTRDADTADDELRELLKDFPSVEVRRLAGGLIVAGSVSSKDDLAAIEKMATAAKAKSVVRYVPPGGGVVAGPPTPSTGTGTGPGTGTGTGPTSGGATVTPTAPGVAVIEYEVELLEASTQFSTGSYARGIEPSGRSMYKGVVRAGVGQEQTVFIGGKALAPPPDPKDKKKNKKDEPAPTQAEGPETGIWLTVRPNAQASGGVFKTEVLIETNVPLRYDLYDPESKRRSRWTFSSRSGEPFGLSGNDLLAAPDISGGSALGSATRTAQTASRIPGVSGAPGVEYVPVFGTLFRSNAYKKKQTQLLVVVRPRVVPPTVPQ